MAARSWTLLGGRGWGIGAFWQLLNNLFVAPSRDLPFPIRGFLTIMKHASGEVAEVADAHDLGSCGAIHVGSSPTFPIARGARRSALFLCVRPLQEIPPLMVAG